MTGPDRSTQPSAGYGTLSRYIAVFFLFVLFCLLVLSVVEKSPTADEQNHIARGLAYLKTGDLRLSQEHPPGVNVWAAWTLLLDPDIHLPLDSPSWANGEWYGFADELLWRANDRPQAMVFATRVPVMWLTLILAAVVYRWGRALGGVWAGDLALALTVFCPNILAHGRLTTTDMGVTVLSLIAMWALWSALRAGCAPSWGRWAAAGLAFGALFLSKFSALVLGPASLVIVLLVWGGQLRALGFRESRPGQWALRLLVLYGVAGLVVWAGYRFTWGAIAPLGDLPGPAPAYWSGVDSILQRTGGGSTAFLLGRYSESGWWYYFPLAFAVKTPLPTLIVLGLALVVGIGLRQERGISAAPRLPSECCAMLRQTAKPPNHQTTLLCLLFPILAFWAMAVGGGFNIGYRHILPSLPFLYVLAGWPVGVWLGRGQRTRARRWGAAACGGLLLWLALGTLFLAPHYLASFNLLAGGPGGGYRVLVDSNLDWGQDLPALAKTFEDEPVRVSWFGAAHPEAYDFAFHPLPGFWRFRGDPAAYGLNPYAPAPGIYAISATNLQGIKLADRDTYAWFREREPFAHVGHSVLLYRVEGDAADRAVVLGVPMAQLADEERALLAGGASVRQYDPATGIILPLSLAAEKVWFVAPQPPDKVPVVRQGPGYAVFQIEFGPVPQEVHDVRFGSHVRLRDHKVSLSQDSALVARAVWEVTDLPHSAAVSFAHLLDREGRYLAGWDGLTAPATCWQEGDLIVQDYWIALPDDLAPGTYQVEFGWYDPYTMARWPCTVDGEPIGDRFLVKEVRVEP